LEVRRAEVIPKAGLDVIEIAKQSGFPYQEDYNDGMNQQGISVIQVNASKGSTAVRSNPYDDFVKSVQSERSNLIVKLGMQVSRILFEEKKDLAPRAIGVEVLSNPPITFKAKRDVILTCGSYNTPKLLQLSGIGDAEQLKQFQIKVIKDLPGVGQNLQDHLFGFYQFVANDDSNYPGNEPSPDWAQLHMFGCLDGTLNEHRPDFQIYFIADTIAHKGFTNDVFEGQNDQQPLSKAWGFLYVFLHPEARGSVTLKSTDPADLPVINMNSLTNARDNSTINRIFEKVVDLAAKFQQKYPSKPVYAPGVNINHTNPKTGQPISINLSSDIPTYIRETVISMWHPVSTCRMGTDFFAVVDPITMKVRGVEGLRVADASVMPLDTSGNTHVPTMATAHRAATLILN